MDSERLINFLTIRRALPEVSRYHKSHVVVSIGHCGEAMKSDIHICTKQPCHYYLFLKRRNSKTKKYKWVCTDTEMQQIVDDCRRYSISVIHPLKHFI